MNPEDVHGVLDWTERLVTPPPKSTGATYSSAETVRMGDDETAAGEATLQSELKGGPTLPLRGDTDQPGTASNFRTAEAVASLVGITRVLVQRIEQLERSSQTDPRISIVEAEHAAHEQRIVNVEATQQSLATVVNGWRWQFWPLLGFSALNLAGLIVVLLIVLWSASHMAVVR